MCTSEGETDCIRENLEFSSSKVAQKVQNNAWIVIFFAKANDLVTKGWWYKEQEVEYYLWII